MNQESPAQQSIEGLVVREESSSASRFRVRDDPPGEVWEVLRTLSDGGSTRRVLEDLVRIVERDSADSSASILLLNADGSRLRHGVALSVPEGYWRAIDGERIGPRVGCCGSAAFLKATVVVEDMAADPLGEGRREAARLYGIGACWSTPILTEGEVLGTFAMHCRVARPPSRRERRLIGLGAEVAAVAISVRRDRRRARAAEALLSFAGAGFPAVFAASPDAVVLADAEGRIVEVNEAASRLAGLSRDEMVGRTTIDLGIRLDGETEKDPLTRLLEEGRTREREVLLPPRQGEPRFGRLSAMSLSIDGEPHVLGILRDVTQQDRTEAWLRESERRFQRALENIPDVVVMYDRDLRIRYINEATRQVTGRPASDFLGRRDDEIWPPEVHGAYLPTLVDARDTGEPRSVDVRLPLPETGTRHLSITCVPLKDDRGEVIEVVGITQDRTEQERANDALKTSEQKFKDVFESANVGKSITLPTGEITVNDAFARLLGYERGELENRTWQSLTPPEEVEATEESLAPLLSGEADSGRFVKRYVRKDGSLVSADVSTVLRRDGERRPLYFITTIVDVTAEHEALDQLRHSEQKFSRVFQRGPAGMTITRIEDGRFLDANDAFLRTFEFSREEVIGRTSTELGIFALEERAELIERQVRAEGLRQQELRASAKSGAVKTILFSSQPVEIDGEACHVTTFIDVTERKHLQAQLLRAQERLQEAVRAGNVGLWDWDLRTDSVHFSREWKNQIGFDEDEICDSFSEWQERVHPDDLGRVLQNARDFIATPWPDYRTEFRLRHKDGSYRWILAQAALVCDEGGEPLRMVGSHVDITAQMEAAQALEDRERQLRLFVEHSPAAIAMFDREMRYLVASRRWNVDYELGEQEIVGRSHFEVLPNLPAKWKQAYRRCLAGAVERCEEDLLERRNRRFDWVRWEVRPWRRSDDEIGGIIVFSEIITERKLAQDELREVTLELERRVAERTSELESRQRQLETFAYAVSHDLKAPLRGLDGYSRLLLEDHADQLDAEGRRFLATIREASQQMSHLIDDLLAYSRIERRSLQQARVGLRSLVESLLRDIAPEIRSRGIEMVVDVPDVTATVDSDGLAMAVRNLLDNALKFTRGASPPRIEVRVTEGATGWLLQVRDNGIGFDMRYRDRIFEIFQRLHRSDEYPGTGVGLAMVRMAMGRMGGRVWAESEPGRGASFWLEVPR